VDSSRQLPFELRSVFDIRITSSDQNCILFMRRPWKRKFLLFSREIIFWETFQKFSTNFLEKLSRKFLFYISSCTTFIKVHIKAVGVEPNRTKDIRSSVRDFLKIAVRGSDRFVGLRIADIRKEPQFIKYHSKLNWITK
jgi:hypothetical protein